MRRAPATATTWSVAVFLLAASVGGASAQMTLPGTFGVNATGAADYSIPIAVPPGTAGVAPALTLEYSSQGGDGILGIGWSLGGLPSVDRCPMTLAQDGVRGSVNFDANDRFCLSGQRLFAISGGYGADGAEYRTEIESFNRVISHGTAGNGPAWFEVRTKSGQIMEFGHTSDSQILVQNAATVRTWEVSKVSDTKGNYLTVSYNNASASGQAYPIEIDYTGNAAAGLAPYLSVKFVYAARPDITPRYHAGSLSQTTVRLTDVQIFVGSTLLTDYRLSYQNGSATGRSRLTSVQRCDGSSPPNCLPATTFGWQEGGGGFFVATVSSGHSFSTDPSDIGSSITFNGPGLIALDLNGDGKTDFVQQWNNGGTLWFITYLSNGDGTFTVGTFNTGNGFDTMGPGRGPGTLALDLNGDGKTDLVQQWNNGGHLTLITYISKGDGTFTIGSYSSGDGFDTVGTNPDGSPRGNGLLALDLNGDARIDLVQQFNDAGHLTIITYMSNGDGTFTRGAFATGGGFDSMGTFPNGAGRGSGLMALDLNGDGKVDLLQQFNDAGNLTLITFMSNGDGTFTRGAFATGGGFDSMGTFPDGSGGRGPGLLVADLNGDGKSDLVQQVNISGNLSLFTFISKGDGTFVPGSFTAGVGFESMGTSPNGDGKGPGLLPIDLNGDGKTDFIQQDNNGGNLAIITYTSNGDGTFTVASFVFNAPFDSLGLQLGPGLIPVDLNGDGKGDIVQPWNNGGTLYFISYLGNAPFPDLLSTIVSGLGATTSIVYMPLTNSTVYTKDTNSTYPVQDVIGPLWVAQRVDASNGVGGTYSSSYAYVGAKSDATGRFLGFRQVKAADLMTNVVQTTNYRQDFPYLGLVASSTKALNGAILNQATNSYGTTALGGTRNQVFMTQSVEQSSDLDGTPVPSVTTTYQYDSFGNATQVVVSSSDGFSKTTNSTYTNDTTSWFLGRLTSASVTSVAPTPPPAPSPSSPPDLVITVFHSGNFVYGQIGANYRIVVSNVGTGSTFGTVTVTDTLPAGLTATAISGAGWSCTLGTLTCTRGDVTAAGTQYPAIVLTVNVASNAPASVTNAVTVAGGGETNASNDTASDPTTITPISVTISAGTNNLNLWNYVVANGFATAGQVSQWNITIGGVFIGSGSTGAYALDTGAFPAGSTVLITNNGVIEGAGGSGGAGGACVNFTSASPGSPGAAGGPAFHAQVPVTVVNNGAIWGGAGGGGGGGAGSTSFAVVNGSGGGGGAGNVTAAGGAAGGSGAAAGGASSISGGGAGGGSGNPGGSGGAPGQPGGGGAPGSGSCSMAGGAGGATGAAVVGNSLVTWRPTGDVRGSIF